MIAKKQNLVIEQGSSIHFEFQLFDVNEQPLTDTTGYSAIARVRQSWEANNIYNFTTSIGNGVVYLDMAPSYSNTIPANNYYYDVCLIGANTTNRIMEGMVTVTSDF